MANGSGSRPPDDWPKLIDGRKAIAKWEDSSRQHRVYLVSRTDKTYGFWAERFHENECDYCGSYWAPEHRRNGIYDSKDTAINEIHSTCPWTVGIEPEWRGA